MTFSIVAWDPTAPDGREWGVAVASKFLAAASVVSWARAGAGAVATQALANVTYGPAGLELLAGGRSATESIERLTSQDDERDHRQLGVIDSDGNAATFTGTECLHWAGGRTGVGYSCQGNILAGPNVIDSMAATFESTEGDLATRLMAALYAGDRAGGDSRGRQAAGLLVVREGGGYLGDTDVAIDLRVDDHADPVPELQRLLEFVRFDRGQALTASMAGSIWVVISRRCHRCRQQHLDLGIAISTETHPTNRKICGFWGSQWNVSSIAEVLTSARTTVLVHWTSKTTVPPDLIRFFLTLYRLSLT